MLAERFAHAIGFVAGPNPIVPQHKAAVAYLGGLGVLVGVLVGLAVGPSRWPPTSALVGMGLYTLLGIADDAKALRPGVKIVLQGAAAATTVALGLKAIVTGIPAVDAALAAFLMVTMVNAVNLTDVCDGLVASVAIVALLGAALAFDRADPSMCVAGSGACAGFLLRNRPPARIFLGDAGSHLVGFLFAAAWIDAMASSTAKEGFLGGLLISGVFVFELVFLIFVRARKGLPVWRGSPDHFSLRLQAAGWSRLQVDGLAALSAAGLAGLACAMNRIGAVSTVLLAVVWAAVAAAYLARHAAARTGR